MCLPSPQSLHSHHVLTHSLAPSRFSTIVTRLRTCSNLPRRTTMLTWSCSPNVTGSSKIFPRKTNGKLRMRRESRASLSMSTAATRLERGKASGKSTRTHRRSLHGDPGRRTRPRLAGLVPVGAAVEERHTPGRQRNLHHGGRQEANGTATRGRHRS